MYICIHIQIYIYIYICVYIYIYICMHVCMYGCMDVYMYIYIHIHTVLSASVKPWELHTYEQHALKQCCVELLWSHSFYSKIQTVMFVHHPHKSQWIPVLTPLGGARIMFLQGGNAVGFFILRLRLTFFYAMFGIIFMKI